MRCWTCPLIQTNPPTAFASRFHTVKWSRVIIGTVPLSGSTSAALAWPQNPEVGGSVRNVHPSKPMTNKISIEWCIYRISSLSSHIIFHCTPLLFCELIKMDQSPVVAFPRCYVNWDVSPQSTFYFSRSSILMPLKQPRIGSGVNAPFKSPLRPKICNQETTVLQTPTNPPKQVTESPLSRACKSSVVIFVNIKWKYLKQGTNQFYDNWHKQ